MKSKNVRKAAGTTLTSKRIEDMVERLAENKPVRRSIAEWGRIHIDRQLPFLCVYRRPASSDDETTGRLIVSEAAYVLAPGDRSMQRPLAELVKRIAALMVERFGAFLILELWAEGSSGTAAESLPPRPGFCVYQSRRDKFSVTLNTLLDQLGNIRTSKRSAGVNMVTTSRIAPPHLPPLLSAKELEPLGCFLIGLGIQPIYMNPKTGAAFPLLLRSLKRQVGRVLDQTFYSFSREHTTHQPAHYYSLGRRAMVKAVWDIDRRLAAVSNSFDLLLQVTPVNAERAWAKFRRQRFEKEPVFLYRPRAVDPGRMKRTLYDIHVERIEDPTLMHLFLDKQMELDRQLTMIHDLGTKQFLYESLQLHGTVTPALARVAQKVLDGTPSRTRTSSKNGMLTAKEFAGLARKEIAWYAAKDPGFKATAQVSEEMYSGLLVSRGKLLVGKGIQVPRSRADALLQHEIGTHLLTYYNGQAQPFKMLYSGLPGYDELQEGLAVLAEYLCGGLSASRLRVLAARVVAARALLDGAGFVEVFRLLDRTYDFPQRTAYTITMRVFRGGGLLKDAVYFRGLIGILKHLAKGGDFEMLFIGKIAAGHVAVIEELLLRKILTPPPVFPRYLESEKARTRLERIRKGMTVLQLLGNHKEKS